MNDISKSSNLFHFTTYADDTTLYSGILSAFENTRAIIELNKIYPCRNSKDK